MATNTTITRDIHSLDEKTGNLYESIAIISKRSNQMTVKLKEEIANKLAEFTVSSDSLEEILENREQIEISRQYERMPKAAIQAIEEFIAEKTYFRNPSKEQK